MTTNFNISINKTYVIEAIILSDGLIDFKVILLQKKGQKLSRTELSDNSELPLKKILKRDYPVVLNITGKGIVSKKLEKKGEPSEKQILNQLLANANLTDFSLQYFELSDKFVASAIRSEALESVVKKIPPKNIIVDIYIGDFVIAALSKLKGSQDNINLHRYHFILNNDEIIDYDLIEQPNDFRHDNEVIDPKWISSYASGFNFFTNAIPASTAGIEWLNFNIQQQQQKQVYNYVRLGLMGILLAIFLINDYYASSYGNELNTLQATQEDKVLKQKELALLTVTIDAKKQFLSASGMQNKQPLAKLADDIAMSTPKSIYITEIIQEPTIKNLSKKRRAEFATRKMVIRGICRSAQTVNLWLEDIKSMTWVNQAVISNYLKDRKTSNSEFELEIISNGILE